MRRTIAAIAPHDSVERFEGLGVKVIQAAARFTGPRTIEAGAHTIAARRFVLATGSSPFVPPIDGLDAVPFLTNETIFELDTLPRHLMVIGGGPIGIEMAQAHRHLGAQVTVLEMASIMPRDDPELVDILRARLAADGVDIREGVRVTGVERTEDGLAVAFDNDGSAGRVEGSHLLIAAGRRVNVDGLGLDEAGIAYTGKGVQVDARLRTTNRRVFAVGDVTGGYQFTHVAGHHAGVVIRNALLRLPARTDMRAVPWVTYTAPELAQVGPERGRGRCPGIGGADSAPPLRRQRPGPDRSGNRRSYQGGCHPPGPDPGRRHRRRPRRRVDSHLGPGAGAPDEIERRRQHDRALSDPG